MLSFIQRYESISKIMSNSNPLPPPPNKKLLTKITLGCLCSLTNIRCRPILDIGWSGWCSKGNLSWGVAGRCWRVFSHRRCVIQYLEILHILIFNGHTRQTELNWKNREVIKILSPPWWQICQQITTNRDEVSTKQTWHTFPLPGIRVTSTAATNMRQSQPNPCPSSTCWP